MWMPHRLVFLAATAMVAVATPPIKAETNARVRSSKDITDADRQHWSFRPLQKIHPPKEQAVQPVDAFIRQALDAKGIAPNPPADARTLVRRIYFDLVGLPPSPDEMALWSQRIENSAENIQALVEVLLDNPHYGERWARHWLDVARYADSNGMESDNDRPNAYHFRDFVIQSLNEDLPFNTFVQWQLAGDEIAPDNPRAIAATGFIVAGSSTILNVPMEEEKLRNRANELDDMVSTTSQALLGLTLACARCHDHKYDALPTRDYYRLMRVFNSGDRTEVPLVPQATAKAHRAAMETWQREKEAAVKKLDAWLKKERNENPPAKKLKDADYIATLPDEKRAVWGELNRQVNNLDKHRLEALPTTFAFADFSSEPRETWLFERGDFMARHEKMDLGFLTVLTNGKSAEDYWLNARSTKLRNDSTQQRRALADWMTDLDHGAGVLLARVIVNRVWQHHFGNGLVRTVSDFGIRGESPTHPELLEWLVDEFIRSGWSLKHLHRLMMNSATYQQAGTFHEAKSAVDPENRLLWRRQPQRIESEILRDAMLGVAGTLNTEMFGPSFKPPIANEALQARNVKDPYPTDAKDTSATRRRTVYMFHKRVVQYPLMQAFDAPDAQSSCGRRMNTTVAPQALALLNDPFVRLRSEELAKRLRTEAGPKIDLQIRHAFQLCFSRDPSPEELADTLTFVTTQTDARREREHGQTEEISQHAALSDFCQALFGLNEFIYID